MNKTSRLNGLLPLREFPYQFTEESNLDKIRYLLAADIDGNPRKININHLNKEMQLKSGAGISIIQEDDIYTFVVDPGIYKVRDITAGEYINIRTVSGVSEISVALPEDVDIVYHNDTLTGTGEPGNYLSVNSDVFKVKDIIGSGDVEITNINGTYRIYVLPDEDIDVHHNETLLGSGKAHDLLAVNPDIFNPYKVKDITVSGTGIVSNITVEDGVYDLGLVIDPNTFKVKDITASGVSVVSTITSTDGVYNIGSEVNENIFKIKDLTASSGDSIISVVSSKDGLYNIRTDVNENVFRVKDIVVTGDATLTKTNGVYTIDVLPDEDVVLHIHHDDSLIGEGTKDNELKVANPVTNKLQGDGISITYEESKGYKINTAFDIDEWKVKDVRGLPGGGLDVIELTNGICFLDVNREVYKIKDLKADKDFLGGDINVRQGVEGVYYLSIPEYLTRVSVTSQEIGGDGTASNPLKLINPFVPSLYYPKSVIDSLWKVKDVVSPNGDITVTISETGVCYLDVNFEDTYVNTDETTLSGHGSINDPLAVKNPGMTKVFTDDVTIQGTGTKDDPLQVITGAVGISSVAHDATLKGTGTGKGPDGNLGVNYVELDKRYKVHSLASLSDNLHVNESPTTAGLWDIAIDPFTYNNLGGLIEDSTTVLVHYNSSTQKLNFEAIAASAGITAYDLYNNMEDSENIKPYVDVSGQDPKLGLKVVIGEVQSGKYLFSKMNELSEFYRVFIGFNPLEIDGDDKPQEIRLSYTYWAGYPRVVYYTKHNDPDYKVWGVPFSTIHCKVTPCTADGLQEDQSIDFRIAEWGPVYVTEDGVRKVLFKWKKSTITITLPSAVTNLTVIDSQLIGDNPLIGVELHLHQTFRMGDGDEIYYNWDTETYNSPADIPEAWWGQYIGDKLPGYKYTTRKGIYESSKSGGEETLNSLVDRIESDFMVIHRDVVKKKNVNVETNERLFVDVNWEKSNTDPDLNKLLNVQYTNPNTGYIAPPSLVVNHTVFVDGSPVPNSTGLLTAPFNYSGPIEREQLPPEAVATVGMIDLEKAFSNDGKSIETYYDRLDKRMKIRTIGLAYNAPFPFQYAGFLYDIMDFDGSGLYYSMETDIAIIPMDVRCQDFNLELPLTTDTYDKYKDCTLLAFTLDGDWCNFKQIEFKCYDENDQYKMYYVTINQDIAIVSHTRLGAEGTPLEGKKMIDINLEVWKHVYFTPDCEFTEIIKTNVCTICTLWFENEDPTDTPAIVWGNKDRAYLEPENEFLGGIMAYKTDKFSNNGTLQGVWAGLKLLLDDKDKGHILVDGALEDGQVDACHFFFYWSKLWMAYAPAMPAFEEDTIGSLVSTRYYTCSWKLFLGWMNPLLSRLGIAYTKYTWTPAYVNQDIMKNFPYPGIFGYATFLSWDMYQHPNVLRVMENYDILLNSYLDTMFQYFRALTPFQ